MQWLDVCGAPGSGKSTLCDALWHPHEIVTDHKLPPVAWQDFMNEVTRLLSLIENHPSFVAAVRMNQRTFRKMSAVSRMKGKKPYIQTGFVQRGLGFGWRMIDAGISIDELRHYYRLMPVSLGVAFIEASVSTVQERNRDRAKVAETSHENRDFMVPLMGPGIEIAKEVLDDRGIPFTTIDTENGTVEECRARLVELADEETINTSKVRPDYQEAVLSKPVWWG